MTVALVLAGGRAEEFPPGTVPACKALLPVQGQPIASYVLRALEQSQVESIFVVYDEGADLPAALAASPKCVFLKNSQPARSFSASLFFGLEQVAQSCGQARLRHISIMIVPCDIPLATPANFNALMDQAARAQGDVTVAIIAERLIQQRFPRRRFRSAYLADYQARYALQSIGFVNGASIRCEPTAPAGRARLAFGGMTEPQARRLRETLDRGRDHRHHNYRLPRFTEIFLAVWLARAGYIYYLGRFLLDLALKRLTMARVLRYLGGAWHLRPAFIVSEEAELSADVDRPEDFQMLLGIAWTPDPAAANAAPDRAAARWRRPNVWPARPRGPVHPRSP